MGIHKGSTTKSSSSSSARRYKSLTASKKSAFITQNIKSQHFPPSAPVVREVKIIKGWEAWEEQLLLDGRKAGRTIIEMSKDLPGRSRQACATRWHDVLKFRSQTSDSPQKEALASSVTKSQYLMKEWEDWEDQIVIKHRSAGEAWEDVSKLLPHRTTAGVKARWLDHLRFPLQERVDRQPRARTPPPSVKSEKVSNRWNKTELLLLFTLRDAGKSWEEISKHLPSRTAKSARDRYHYPTKQQGKARETTYLRSHSQEVVAPQTQSPSPPSIKPSGRLSNAWTEQEDQLLISLRHEGKGWAEIGSNFPYHSKGSCQSRWREYLHPRTGASRIWTSEDEQRLCSLYKSNPDDWEYIASQFPNRTWLGCKMHWVTKLRGPTPKLKRRWKRTEKETLVDLYNTIGPRWQEIANHLSDRTEGTIRSKFYNDRERMDGVGGPSSKYWEDYFENEPEPDDADANAMEASDTGAEQLPTIKKNQPASMDARKRKVIDIPMV